MKSRLLNKKTGTGWDAPTEKWHYKEDQQVTKKVWNGIADKLNQLKSTLKVKGKPLAQYNLKDVFQSEDPEVKRAGYQVRSLINQYVSETFDAATLAKFKQDYGSNVTDWLTRGKRASTGFKSALYKKASAEITIESDVNDDLNHIASILKDKDLNPMKVQAALQVIKQAKSKIGYLDKI
jgi:hypothetical protein